MKKQTKMLLLIGWFILAAVIYFTAINYEFEPVILIYAVMSMLFGVAFLLVNGGVRSTIKTSAHQTHTVKTSKKQKTRMRYHKEESALPTEEELPRLNIFRLSPEKQKFFAELFLILFLAPTVVLAVDYVLIAFIPDYK